MASVSVSLPVPGVDGVGAFVDCSGLSPERTINFDGGAFSGSLFLEGTNDAGASVFPLATGPFTGVNGSPAPQPLLATVQQMRVRRAASTGGPAGAPTVTISASAASSNVFADLPVPAVDGVGAGVDVSTGGDVNTIGVQGPFSGQIIIEVSTDGGTTFVGSALLGMPSQTTPGSPAAFNLTIGAISQVRVRRNGSITGQPSPLVSVGSGSSAGGGGAFPGFGVPGNIGPNEPVTGVQNLAARADSIPGQKIEAQWPIANVRWYAVDGANGNDANAGFSDANQAAAGAVAKKTLAGLGAIFPRVGAGRQVVVAIAAATYTDGLDTFLAGIEGYAANFPLVVGTATNATAGSVAFSGNANDRIYAGAVTVPGLNAAGYNPTGAPTQSVVQCVLTGGGAPAFPAEPAAPLGWRIRFDINTTTAALRNVCAMILGVSTDTLTLPNATTGGMALPAVPVASDVFYVEQAGVNVGPTVLNFNGSTVAVSSVTLGFLNLVGLNIGAVSQFTGGGVRPVFCSMIGTSSFFGTEIDSPIIGYRDETATTRNVGSTIRFGATVTMRCAISGLNFFSNNNPAVFVGTWVVDHAQQLFICNSGVLARGVGLINVIGDVVGNAAVTEPGSFIGGRLVNAQGSVRITGSAATPAVAGLPLSSSSMTLGKLAITGQGANPAIKLLGKCALSVSSSLTGSTGNTDVGLDLVNSWDSTILVTGTPTVTGTAGDIRLANGQIVTWAAVAATGLVDSAGNRFIPVTGPLTILAKFSGGLVASAVAATSAYLPDGGTLIVGAFEGQQLPLRYPTSLRLVTRLRVTVLAGTLTNAVTVTLRKNDVATTMQISIPGGTAANTKFLDTAHPILFVDGDDFDVRLDDAADVGAAGGPLLVSATLEGPC